MLTFQDMQLATSQDKLKEFILQAIEEHKKSELYQTAVIAQEYDKRNNVTINKYKKLITLVTGQIVEDKYKSNHKLSHAFFPFFVNQLNQYELGGGVQFENTENKERFGKDFDMKMQALGHHSLVDGEAYGFWNFDHLEVFRVTEFVPIYDELTAKMCAGIRFWQIDDEKPLRVTLYEIDGYTDYVKKKNNEKLTILNDKRGYILKKTKIANTVHSSFENYKDFPIVVLKNQNAQSELVGRREMLDAYDLLASGFANDIDECNSIYWLVKNAGGMGDEDLTRFMDRINTTKIANVPADQGVDVQAHSVEPPSQARLLCLDRIRDDLYEDFQALDVKKLQGGNKTATEVRASYQLLNMRADLYEYCLLDFLNDLFALLDFEDEVTFQRSMLINQLEVTQMVMLAAPYLSNDIILKKLPFLTPEEVQQIINERDASDFSKFVGDEGDEDEN